MSAIKDIIENPHRVYKNNLNFWEFLLISYEGGLDYTYANVDSIKSDDMNAITVKVNGEVLTKNRNKNNMFPHVKEKTPDFQRRVEMSYYYNFCAPVIDIYTNHLFKQSVIEDFGQVEGLVEQQRDNIDRRGSSIIEFRKEMASLSQIYGHCFALTDSPQSETDILSLQDKMDNGVMPYFTLFHPQSVINWDLDSIGRPNWVCVKECYDSNPDPFVFDKDNVRMCNYRIWTRQEWILFNGQYEEIDRGAHNLGFVPITPVYNTKSRKETEFLGISHIADISFIARDIYNSCSELKQILRDQTFSILALQGDANDFPAVEIATNKGIRYPRDTNPPQYVTPPAGPAETLLTYINTQVHKIYQLANLEGGSVESPDAEQSGISKAWDFNQTNATLAKKSGNLEDAETRMWQMWAKWEGREFDGMISYPREFSVQSLKQDLEESEQMMRMNISSEFNKEIKKAIVTKKFPRLPDDVKETITNEIEAGSLDVTRVSDRINGRFFNNANVGGNNGGRNGRGTGAKAGTAETR